MDEKNKVVRVGESTTFFTSGAPAVYSTNAIKNGGTKSVPEDAKKSKDLWDPEMATNTQDWIPWGDNDNFVDQLLAKLSLLGVGRSALSTNADLHYGLGVKWWKDEYTEAGKRVSKLIKFDDWVRLERDENIEIEIAQAVDSCEHFYIAFVQFMWNKGKTQINWVRTLNTPFVRLHKQKPDGSINKIRYSAKYPETPMANEYQDIDIYSFYHKGVDPREFDTFVMPITYGSWGKLFYPEPDYYAVFRNKWVDIAIGVPALINAIYENFATLKYHIKIPKEYFFSKYKDWDQRTEEQQISIFEEEQTKMNSFLTGKENAGKAFITIYSIDENGQEIPGWVIEPIKNYLEATAELPNNSAANSEILFAMSLDPSLLGFGIPGGKDLSGSGSDKRQARSNKVANLKRERLVTLQIAKMIGKLNGYYTQEPEAYPDYMSSDTSQTLDENPTGSQTIKQ
jgi:hypothetical protein